MIHKIKRRKVSFESCPRREINYAGCSGKRSDDCGNGWLVVGYSVACGAEIYYVGLSARLNNIVGTTCIYQALTNMWDAGIVWQLAECSMARMTAVSVQQN